MRLTVLGSNGTYPTPGRPASGYLVEQRETRVWVDAGPGTFAALQEFMPFREVDAIVISHIHPDHCVDVLAFYHATYYGNPRRTGVPVLAPDGVAEKLGALMGADSAHGLWEGLSFRAVSEGDEVKVGELSLRFALTDHPVPTVAVRAESDGKALVYSSDTGPEGGVAALAEGADLFVCEATYQGATADKPWPHHLTAREAGQLGRTAGVRRLMITHLWPTLDPGRSVAEAEEVFEQSVGLAVPGMRVEA